jgi:hypothetical protein
MFRKALRLFYDLNKFGMNFYWIFYIKAIFSGKPIDYFAFGMFTVSFLYFLSAVAWFLPRKEIPRWK